MKPEGVKRKMQKEIKRLNRLLTAVKGERDNRTGETARQLAIAITHLETALLFIKEANKNGEK